MADLSTPVYHDFQSIQAMKSKVDGAERASTTQEVAKQFEAFFIQQMLKSMRSANEAFKSGLVESNSIDTFEQMFDQQLSVSMADRGGLGFAEKIARAVERMQPASVSPPLNAPTLPLNPVRGFQSLEPKEPVSSTFEILNQRSTRALDDGESQ